MWIGAHRAEALLVCVYGVRRDRKGGRSNPLYQKSFRCCFLLVTLDKSGLQRIGVRHSGKGTWNIRPASTQAYRMVKEIK